MLVLGRRPCALAAVRVALVDLLVQLGHPLETDAVRLVCKELRVGAFAQVQNVWVWEVARLRMT